MESRRRVHFYRNAFAAPPTPDFLIRNAIVCLAGFLGGNTRVVGLGVVGVTRGFN